MMDGARVDQLAKHRWRPLVFEESTRDQSGGAGGKDLVEFPGKSSGAGGDAAGHGKMPLGLNSGSGSEIFLKEGERERILQRQQQDQQDQQQHQRHYVSFSIPRAGQLPHHRYSISTKPVAPKSNSSEDGKSSGDGANGPETLDGELEEKDCSMQMPGDFIYMNKRQNASVPKISTSGSHSGDPLMIRRNSADTKMPTDRTVFKKRDSNVESPVPFTQFFQNEDDKKFHILIGATGSVATIKIPMIIDKLFKIYTPEKVSIQLIVTKPAEHFLNGLRMSSEVKIWREEDANATDFNNDILLFHELRRWADIFLIAPLSANTLAKLANGICNNLLTSVIRDWTGKTPVIVAPAMNTFMYINPMTRKHLTMLNDNFPFLEVLKPVEKVLICGDIGMGGMREWNDIVEHVRLKIKDILRARHEDADDNEDKEVQTVEHEMEEVDEEDNDEDEEDDEDGEDDDNEDDDDDDDDDENSNDFETETSNSIFDPEDDDEAEGDNT
ncbi:phosphopantothenoylcysteine decarboxylase complex subunit CAB3 KNAG_0M02480 [Huiozyma naganishii CBS 8797]|uniref:Flavoprotein domain-containing protein n=1 Tax=Huiozyma naganishii (strain ATCC MYA-139 / BCRC 22969 / CBS 8797 / KCTC 17520 / NBRC 10181 / NCYC 3082 / Yp74L-3) TaxID=1071383 RepID=J7SBJ8_HUIN7|nr:hypothetical protein KNAG_0M02480 [Kazachstania naganishii CBS 8797]CCK73101.1 hypothetical protein KNAG_0M02480 [Kazachstania naganishii CBS 8797]